jgi:hypothetical protein
MNLDYVPLLTVQRELQGIPRSLARFRQYLRTVLSDGGADVELIPLLVANPMARDHVTALLDALLALDADGVGAAAAAEASAALADVPGNFKVSLVVADDLLGGWTNRYATEFTFRSAAGVRFSRRAGEEKWSKRVWVTGLLWSSEPATARAAREAVLTAAYRMAYVHRHGPHRTLRELLAQEGWVLAAAGCAGPVLDEEDLDYTREVLAPLLDADDMRTAVECLFGDAAARTLGFTPRGLSPWAGLALALHDVRQALAPQPAGSA